MGKGPDSQLDADFGHLAGPVSDAEIHRLVAEVLESGGRGALATVVGRSGSAPQILGAKLLMRDDGAIFGTVGGGAIEAQVLDACRQTLRFGVSRRVEANLVRDLAMCCGGSMEIFVEHLEGQPRLIILGAGHVSRALAPLAATTGFAVEVLDDREELLTDAAFAEVATRAYDADELGDAIPDPRAGDYIVIVTRDHQRDERALAMCLERPHAYLGMIGSRRKVHTVLRRVLRRYDERDRARPDLSKLRAPIGLALGGRTPAEIAVSIAAELVAHRRDGDGSRMSIVDDIASATDGPDDGG